MCLMTISKPLVAVLYGGKSTEHEVSVHSAQTVCQLLRRSGRYEVLPVFINKEGFWFLQEECSEQTARDIAVSPVLHPAGSLWVSGENRFLRPDVFFPVLHGTHGEDGTMQGLLESLDVPYVGSGVVASAVGMDKELTKLAAQQAGVPTLPHLKITSAAYDRAAAEAWAAQTGYPVFVKPMCLGSSVGVSKVKDAAALHPAIEMALRFDTDVLVEKGLESPREIFCGLLGERDQVRISECGELKSLQGEFFDYEAKYITVGGCETRVPAPLPESTRRAIQEGSRRIFQALRCSGLARADFLVDRDGKAWFSEINTLPGLSTTSLYPQLFEASGLAYPAVLEELIALALRVHARKKTLVLERPA